MSSILKNRKKKHGLRRVCTVDEKRFSQVGMQKEKKDRTTRNKNRKLSENTKEISFAEYAKFSREFLK